VQHRRDYRTNSKIAFKKSCFAGSLAYAVHILKREGSSGANQSCEDSLLRLVG
jgi:hypothetical protein